MIRIITLPFFMVLGLIVGIAMFFLSIAMALQAGWRIR
jgi:hypothetical protein